MTTPDPLASVRAKLKSAPKPPASKAPSSDPLAAVRARVKAGKGTTLKPVAQLTSEQRLARLEAAVQWMTQLGSETQNKQLRELIAKTSA
jgi:hypothetical protein